MTDSNNTDRRRRTVLKTLGGGTMALLAGCTGGGGGSAETEGSSEASTTSSGTAGGSGSSGSADFTFWTTQVENDRKQVIGELVSSYESGHESAVQMNAVKENDLPSQISSARASSTLPAIGEWGLGAMQRLGSGGLLSKEGASNVIESIGEDKFYDGALALTQAPDGGHFAVPFHGWLQGFWYSKSKFEELGLDEPTTWDGLLAAAEALHKPDDNQFGIVVGTKQTAFARQCFTPFARSNGARVFNEQGDIVFDSDAMVEALDFYAQLAEYTPPGKDTWKTANNTYLNDQCHLIEYSTYLMGGVTDKSQEMVEDTAFAPYIEKKRKSSFGQIVALNLLSSSTDQERQAAESFAEYLLTGEQYVKWLHMAPGGMNTVLKPTAESDAYQDNELLKAWGDTVSQISAGFQNIERFGYVNGKAFPEFGKITNQFLVAQAVSRVTSGEDPETVATEQAEKMRELLSE